MKVEDALQTRMHLGQEGQAQQRRHKKEVEAELAHLLPRAQLKRERIGAGQNTVGEKNDVDDPNDYRYETNRLLAKDVNDEVTRRTSTYMRMGEPTESLTNLSCYCIDRVLSKADSWTPSLLQRTLVDS